MKSPEERVHVLSKTMRNSEETIEIDDNNDEESGDENNELFVQQKERDRARYTTSRDSGSASAQELCKFAEMP